MQKKTKNFGRKRRSLKGNQKFWKEDKIRFWQETKQIGKEILTPLGHRTNLMHEEYYLIMASFCRELFYVWKSIVFILMVPPCHQICKRHLCYLQLGKRDKSYNLSSCDLISNNRKQFLTYLGTTHLSPLTVSFLQKRKQIKIFYNISLYRTFYVTEIYIFETSSKCNFPWNYHEK